MPRVNDFTEHLEMLEKNEQTMNAIKRETAVHPIFAEILNNHFPKLINKKS
jgi:hypothetical protein